MSQMTSIKNLLDLINAMSCCWRTWLYSSWILTSVMWNFLERQHFQWLMIKKNWTLLVRSTGFSSAPQVAAWGSSSVKCCPSLARNEPQLWTCIVGKSYFASGDSFFEAQLSKFKDSAFLIFRLNFPNFSNFLNFSNFPKELSKFAGLLS